MSSNVNPSMVVEDINENGEALLNTGLEVFPLIQRVKSEIERSIDSVMTYDQLCQASSDYAVVKPLTTLLARCKHPALIYALLVCRVHFLAKAEEDLAFQGVNTTRASLCQLLATKLLSLWDTRSMEFATVLMTPYNPFSGVSRGSFMDDVSLDEIDELRAQGSEDATSAMEVAIQSGAKKFCGMPAVQHVVQSIYEGRIIFRPNTHSLIQDNYKAKPISHFDVTRRPILDHYVLCIPKVRRGIEFGTLLVLIILFMLLQQTRVVDKIEVAEIVFMIYGLGFVLDETSILRERGLKTYLRQFWNFLDIGFVLIFLTYFVMRIIGAGTHSKDLSILAFDILALGACLLYPRLCGMLLADSVTLIGLRAMLADYVAFMILALICSLGFLIAFSLLAERSISLGQLAWILVKVFLGNSYVGFDVAHKFGAHIGPALMLVFAIFSNTLLLTILISILSNTFAAVQGAAVEEALFHKAATTLEMANKGDALAEFLVPANLVALPLLLPASCILSARRFHSFNVMVVRITNFPLLVGIWLYYRLKCLSSRRLSIQDGSQINVWKPFTRSSKERLFERQVSAAGRKVKGLDEDQAKPARAIQIHGSGGKDALGMSSVNPSPSGQKGVQGNSLLAQLFGSYSGGKVGSPDALRDQARGGDESYTSLENRLEKIEDMLTQLLLGGVKVQDEQTEP